MLRFCFRVVLLLLALWSVASVRAGHIAGGNISYECLGGQSYLVTLTIFRDCSESNVTGNQNIIFRSDCGQLFSVSAPQIFTTEVSQLCPTALANSSCSGGIWPGIEVYKYQTTVDLVPNCNSWEMYWELCARSFTVNVNNTAFPCYRIRSRLNSVTAPCNNSPFVTEEYIPYVCVGQQVNFNPAVNEMDGDSLVYFLTPGLNAGGAPILYEAGFTGVLPVPGITINPNTGQLTFIPPSTGTFTIVIGVNEYNTAGQLLGSITHDIIFVVENCPQPVPQPDPGGFTNFQGTGSLTGPSTIAVCGGDSFCTDIIFSSGNPASIITLSSQISNVLPGATLTQTGTNPAVGTICWTVPGGFSSAYQFNVTAQDNACPVFGVANWGFVITPTIGVYGGPDYVICNGESVQLNASGDTGYLWQAFNGDPIVAGVNFSCIDCPNPIATPSLTTTYLVTGLSPTAACINTDTVVVAIALQDIDIIATSETCFLNDAEVYLNVLYGSGNYTYLWETGETVPNLTDLAAGDYEVFIEDLTLGCSNTATVTIDYPPFPNTEAGQDTIICGFVYDLQPTPSYGSGLWFGPPGSFPTFSPNPFDAFATLSVIQPGSWYFTWREDAGNNCIREDTVLITFVNYPDMDAGPVDSICGLEYQLQGNNYLGGGQWSGPPGSIFLPDNNTHNATVTAPSYGTHRFYWWIDLGDLCTDSSFVDITFLPPLIADGGIPFDTVCSTPGNYIYQLQGVPGGSNNYWYSTSAQPQFSPTNNIHNPTAQVTSTNPFLFIYVVEDNWCIDRDTVRVLFTQQPTAITGPDQVVCALTAGLNANLSLGTGTWSGPPGTVFTPTPNNINVIATVPTYGVYDFVWTRQNIACIARDTTQVTFHEMPIANAGPDDNICGLSYQLQAVPSLGSGIWTGPAQAVFSDTTDPNAIVTMPAQGTYTFTWTETNFTCVNADNVQIIFYSIPEPNAGADDEVCTLNYQFQATNNFGNIAWTGPPGSTFVPNANNLTTTVTAPSFGFHEFVLTANNNGCIQTDTVVIHFREQPVANAGIDDSTCSLQFAFSATPSVGNGSWTLPLGYTVSPNINDPNATVTAPNYGQAVFTWTEDNLGCISSDQITIDFVEQPVANAGIDDTVCGWVYDLQGNAGVGMGTWTGPASAAFSPDASAPNASVTVDAFGPQTFTWTLDNGFGCIATADVIIDFEESPPTFAGNDTVVCGNSIQLSATPGVAQGVWSGPTEISFLPNSNDPNAIATASAFGSYTLTWTIDQGNNCIAQDDVVVNFVEQPVSNAGINQNLCGLSAQLSAIPSAGAGVWYSLIGPTFSPAANDPNATVTFNNPGTYEIWWIENNGFGCTDSASVTITLIAQPVADAGLNIEVCGLIADVEAIPSIGVGSWSTADAGISFGNAANAITTVSSLNYGTYNLTWTEDNGFGCADAADIQVTFVQQPIANAGIDLSVCGDEAVLNAVPSVGTGTWQLPVDISSSGDLNDSQLTINASSYGQFTIVWEEVNGICNSSNSVEVTFTEIPVADAGPDQNVCGLVADIASIPSVGTGSWSAPAAISFNPDNITPATQITANSPGTYNLTWTEDNGNGCTNSDQLTVVFIEIPVADAGVNQSLCGLQALLSASPTAGNGMWSGDPSLVFVPNASAPNATVSALAFGNYTLVWTEDNDGCTGTDQIEIEFIETPIPNAGADDATCGLSYTLQAIPSTGTGSWSGPVGVVFDDVNEPNTNVSVSFTGTYELTWTEDNGVCPASDVVSIAFVTNPVANAGIDENVCGLSYTLQATSNVPNGSWLPQTGIVYANPTDPNTVATAAAFGTYTLIWQATAGASCVDEDEVEITFIEAPVANAGDDDWVCDLNYVLNAVPSGGNGAWSGPAEISFSDQGNPNSLATASAFGTYILVWTESTVFGCNTIDEVEITFSDPPLADAGDDLVICGLAHILSATASVGTGVWTSVPAGVVFTPSASSPTATATVAVPGVYNLTWTETNGNCTSSDVIEITFIDQPAANAGADDTLCGLSYTLSGVGANGIWSGPPGVVFNPSANVPNATAVVPTAGEYTFTYTIDNGNCFSADEVVVEFFDAPQVADVTATCIDGNINYQVSFTISGGDPGSYLVTGGGGTLTGSTFTSSAIQNGFSYSFQVQDANGCQVVAVSGSYVCPTLTYAGTMNQTPLVICGNLPANAIHNANHTLDGNDALIFILHSNPGIPIGTVYAQSNTPSFTFQPGMVYGVTYYISAVVGNSNGAGGVDFSDVLLSVAEGTPVVFSQIPTVNITGGGSACQGETLFATINLTGIGPFSITYSINGSIQPPISTGNNQIEIPLTSNAQVLIQSFSDANCPGQISGVVNASFSPVPNAQISGGGEVCEGESEQIFVQLSGAAPFEFEYAIDGAIQAPINTNLNLYSFNTATEGIYTLISVEDQLCAGNTNGQAELIVNDFPVANAGPDQEICYGSELAQLGTAEVAGYTYQWSNGQFLSDNSSATPEIVYNNPLFVPIELSFTLIVNNNGCITTDEVNVELLPSPEIQTSGVLNICEGGAGQVSVFGASNVQWTPTTFITDANGFNPWVYPPVNTEYSVTTSNSYGCIAEGLVQVVVHPMPVVQFTSNATLACAPVAVTFQNQTIIEPGSTCIWNFGNGNMAYTCNDVVSGYLTNGTYNVSLTVTSPYGCIASNTAYNYINTVGPNADFSYSPKPADVNNPVVQFENLSTGASTFIWDIEGLASFYTVNPVFEFPSIEPGEYEVCLTAISDQGCIDEHCGMVIIKPDINIYVPNAFSPNGDGINDLFYPVIQGVDELIYEMQIFNRRGKMVFQTFDINGKWDGGDLTNDFYDENQIYTWVIRVKDQYSVLKKEYTGHVMLVK
jgi:trimeric autotransporter adhesin